MTEDQFWELIDVSRKQSKDCEGQAQELQKLLFKCSAQEIIEFDRIFRQKLIPLYHWNVWGVACLIQGSCSKHELHAFCGWLIGQGRDAYQQVLNDPQTVLEFVEEDEELLGCDALLHVSSYAYDDVVGDEMPQSELQFPSTMMGNPLDVNNLSEQFPKIAEVFVK